MGDFAVPILNVFGQLENLIADHLYPYRYVITPIAIAVALAIVALAVRAGLHLALWRHRTASVVVGVPVLVLAAIAGSYLVSPLWERSHLVEASPLVGITTNESSAAPAAPTGQGASPPPAQEATIAAPPSAPSAAQAAVPSNTPAASQAGTAVPPPNQQPQVAATAPSIATSAPVTARETHRGQFTGADDFHFGRGKALVIKTATGGNVLRFEDFSVRNGPDLFVYLSKDPSGKRVEESLNLGKLKATDGAFNYEIPANIDLKDIKSVVVWCKQFSVQFSVAELKGS
jgi:hypothetical protein